MAKTQISELLDKIGYGYIMVSENDTGCGAVVTLDDAKKCVDLFKKHKDDICGRFRKFLGCLPSCEQA